MDNMLFKIQDAFQHNFILSFFLVVLTILALILYYELKQMKNNQVNRQLKARLGRDVDESFDFGQMVMDRFDNFEKRIDDELQKANVLFTTKEYFAFMGIGVLAGAGIGFILFPLSDVWLLFFGWVPNPLAKMMFGRVLAGSAFGIVGSLVPKIWLQFLIFRRKKLLQDQIQEALLNLADALKSGQVIGDAIRIVGKELAYPLGPEFARASREMETGKTLHVALNDMKKRIDLEDFTMAINAIEIQFEVGGKLEPLLRKMVGIIEDRNDLKKQIEKTISHSKTTGFFMLGSPIVFIAMFSAMNSEAYIKMLKHPVGLIMTLIALVVYVVSSIWIYNVLKTLSKEV